MIAGSKLLKGKLAPSEGAQLAKSSQPFETMGLGFRQILD